MATKKALKREKRTHRSPFLPGLVVFDAFILAFALLVGAYLVITSQSFAQGMRRLTISEQNEHRQAMLDIIDETGSDADATREVLDGLLEAEDNGDTGDKSKKDDLYAMIDDLEKNALAIDKAYGDYATDMSVSLNPYRDMGIERFVFHSRDLAPKIRRLSRTLDDYLYGSEKKASSEQVGLIDRGFANVRWEIERLQQESR